MIFFIIVPRFSPGCGTLSAAVRLTWPAPVAAQALVQAERASASKALRRLADDGLVEIVPTWGPSGT
jgi:hypothetical protein